MPTSLKKQHLEKQPRTMSPSQFLTKWESIQRSSQIAERARAERIQQLSKDPVDFCSQILGFKPFSYQAEFIKLFVENQFTAARWSRQSGKSFMIAALLLWYATTHPDCAIGIVGPSWRQTKRILTRIATFAHKLPPNIAYKPQKTQIHFSNGGTIEAFPNNPETIRGPTLHVVYCLPANANVTLADGTKTPISKIKTGQEVQSYNTCTGQIEPKKVLNIFPNPKANRKILRITHTYGHLDCTAEHKIYTCNRGYIPASQLSNYDQILYYPTSKATVKTITPTEQQTETVYDLEIEDNHNFFAEDVLVSNCDEMNFIPNDEELYDAILYTLGTTDGKFVCTSTPWHTDSIFFKIFYHKDFSDFKTLHVPIGKALEPNGPLKPNMLQKIKTQMGDDPSRWRREMEAEWAEDDDVWLPQSLIAQCIGTAKNCGENLQEFNPDTTQNGEFYAGLDLAQTKDYTALTVIEKEEDKLYLRHLKIFQQPTLYANVLGYLKALQDRWGGFEKIRVDFTREGPSIIADMENAGIDNAEGVTFSVPRKSEMASLLKQRMANRQFFYPLLSWERPYRGDLCTELNTERYCLRKDGQIGYNHPTGTHDDVFWATALAIYATAEMQPEPFLAVVPR